MRSCSFLRFLWVRYLCYTVGLCARAILLPGRGEFVQVARAWIVQEQELAGVLFGCGWMGKIQALPIRREQRLAGVCDPGATQRGTRIRWWSAHQVVNLLVGEQAGDGATLLQAVVESGLVFCRTVADIVIRDVQFP